MMAHEHKAKGPCQARSRSLPVRHACAAGKEKSHRSIVEANIWDTNLLLSVPSLNIM